MPMLIAFIAFLLPTYLVRFSIAGIPTTLLELLIYAVALAGCVRFLSDQEARTRLDNRRIWLLPAGLILLGGLVGALISPDLRTALGLLKGFIIDPILVYLLALVFVDGIAQARTVAAGAFWGGVGVSIWSLSDTQTVSDLDRFLGPYAADPNASPNYLAFAIAPLLPLSVWLSSSLRVIASEAKQSRDRHAPSSLAMTILYWLGALFLIAALVVSGSRAGLVAGLGGLLLALALATEPTKRIERQSDRANRATTRSLYRFITPSLLLLAALSWFVVRPNFDLSQEVGGRITASNNVRFQLWSATGELMRMHWIGGVGLGNFQPAFTQLTNGRVNYSEFIAPKARTPHNLLVGIWSELGLLGLAGAISALVLVGRTLFGAIRLRSGHVAAASLLGSWFVLLAHGLVDQPIWKNDGMILFWLLIALAASLDRKSQIADRRSDLKS